MDDVKGFKRYFEENLKSRGGFALPGLTSKGNICGSLETLKRSCTPATPEEEEIFKDAVWTYLGDFRNRRTKYLNPLTRSETTKEGIMKFAHCISTDGYSVTLVCTSKTIRGRNHTFRSGVSSRQRKRSKKDDVPLAFREEFPLLTADTVPDILKFLKSIGCTNIDEFAAGDPGKGVLLNLVDEFRNKLRYTAKQRRHETNKGSSKIITVEQSQNPGKKRLRCGIRSGYVIENETMKHRDATVSLPPLRSYQGMRNKLKQSDTYGTSSYQLLKEMSRRHLTPKTICLKKFRNYIAFREASRGVFEETYQIPVFRALRFTAWTKRRSSIECFAKKILEKYGNRRPESKVNKQVVILYGDWGRRPNLKHQAPTPGVGLRRILHGFQGVGGQSIVTITVRETFTSSYDPDSLKPVSEARGVHPLLREDEDVSSSDTKHVRGIYWSRDVLGSLNILRKGKYLLKNNSPHPQFGK